MAEDRPRPEPTPEHKLLEDHAGTWKVQCTYFMNPSHPPYEVTGTEIIEMLGPFWTRSRFQADMGEFQLEGSSTLGFDPHKGKWVSTWIDNTSPILFQFEGDRDPDTGVLELTGTGLNPMTGEPTTFRSVEKRAGPDERHLEMYITLETGDEMQMFSYVYTRADG